MNHLEGSVKELNFSATSTKTMDLNDAQLRAVTHTGGPLMVLAGPGSGKTAVIVERIIYLIEELKVSPSNILVISFTKDAAASMQKRFSKLMDQAPVRFGTFHSVFLSFLTQYAHLNIKIISENDKFKIIEDILNTINNPLNGKILKEDIYRLLSAISMYRNTMDRERAIHSLKIDLADSFDEIVRLYDEFKIRENYLDYDDMINRFHQLIKNDDKLREKIRNSYPYILIDEFQDINRAQYECIRLMADNESNIFVVGDDDQAIYGFRGTTPMTMKQFVHDYSAQTILLKHNYRCASSILDASLKVINFNENRFHKDLLSCNDEQAIFDHKGFENRNQEYSYIAEICRTYLTSSSEGTMAILFRTNSYLECLASQLDRRGILYYTREPSRNLLNNFMVKDILAFLNLASDYAPNCNEKNRVKDGVILEALVRVSHIMGIYISREALSGNRRLNIDNVIGYYESRKGYNSFIISKLKELRRKLKTLGGLSLHAALKFIVHVCGYNSYLNNKALDEVQAEEWREKIEFILEDAKGYSDHHAWLDQTRVFDNKKKSGDSSSRIYLMTIHGSKGLEFDSVIIPDCNENNIPLNNDSEDILEEERRILYVAMTRAKRNLELLYLTGTEEHPRYPSRFINQLITR